MDLRIEAIGAANRRLLEGMAVAPGQENNIEPIECCMSEAERNPAWRPVVILADGMPAGYAMYGFFADEGSFGRVWLDRLMVDQNFQGHGIGSAALNAMIDRLVEEYGCNEIYLSVYESNTRAISMYKRRGFEFNGELDAKGELVMVLKTDNNA